LLLFCLSVAEVNSILVFLSLVVILMKKRKVDSVHDNVRIIAHIDLDCFYVQVERSVNPELNNKPVGVVQCTVVDFNFLGLSLKFTFFR
jgi:hypothetical protein